MEGLLCSQHHAKGNGDTYKGLIARNLWKVHALNSQIIRKNIIKSEVVTKYKGLTMDHRQPEQIIIIIIIRDGRCWFEVRLHRANGTCIEQICETFR